MANHIPYNMWIGEYDELKAKYTGKFGLEFRQRAIVNVEDNKKLFFEVLVEQCMTFCRQMTSDNPVLSNEDVFRQCDEPMTALIHSYFQDYITRLQTNSIVATDIDSAIINWIVSLLTDIFETYFANQGKVLNKCGRTPAVDVASMRFYLDICERNILDIAHVYFQDSERIPLIKTKEEPKEPLESAGIASSDKTHVAAVATRPTGFRTTNQNGNKSVYVGNNTGTIIIGSDMLLAQNFVLR